jgi:hypothetical protein
MAATTTKFPPEVRERAVRMVRGALDRNGSRWQAVCRFPRRSAVHRRP